MEQVLEVGNGLDGGRKLRPHILPMVLHQAYRDSIQTDDSLWIGRVQVDDIVRAVPGNEGEDVFDQAAVRINNGQAIAGGQVGLHHVPEHAGLTYS